MPIWVVNGMEQQEKDEALLSACREGELPTVIKLMQEGADPTAEDDKNNNAFHKACAYGHKAIVEYFLEQTPELISRSNSAGWYPAHSASLLGQVEIVKLLIQHGAKNIPSINNKARTPQQCAESLKKNTSFWLAKKTTPDSLQEIINLWNQTEDTNNNAALSSSLPQLVSPKLSLANAKSSEIDSSLNVNNKTTTKDCQNETPDELSRRLKNACKKTDLDNVFQILKEHQNIVSYNNTGVTVFSFAAYQGNKKILDMLRQCYQRQKEKIPVNTSDKSLSPPLHLAAAGGHTKAVIWLLKYGADPTMYDQWGYTPLHRAAAKGHYTVLLALTTQTDVSINIESCYGQTPLHSAALYGYFNCVKTLEKIGADLFATGPCEQTVIDSALTGSIKNIIRNDVEHTKIIEFLLEKKVRYNINSIDKVKDEAIKDLLISHKELGKDLGQNNSDSNIINQKCPQTALHKYLIDTVADGKLDLIYTAISEKNSGSNPGAIYQAKDGTRWMGKMGYDPLGIDDISSEGQSTRTRLVAGVKLDALKEKVGMDLYKILSKHSSSSYDVPITRIARLKIRDPLILQNEGYARKIDETFDDEIDQTLFVMSHWHEDFILLKQYPAFIAAIKNHCFPEDIKISENHSLSTDGLIRLLAHARIIGDVDVFGIEFDNIGWYMNAGSPVWLKVDGSHVFMGYSDADYLNKGKYRDSGLDPKHIQCNAATSGGVHHLIYWENLSRRQQEIFITELACAYKICNDENFQDLLLFRDNVFEQYDISKDQIIMTYREWRIEWLKKQNDVFLYQLDMFRKKNSNALDAWVDKIYETLGLYSNIQSDDQTIFLEDQASLVISPNIGRTRLEKEIMVEFKRIWMNNKAWPATDVLYNLILKKSDGDSDRGAKILGSIVTNGKYQLRKILESKKADLDDYGVKTNYDYGVSKLLKVCGNLLSENVYEERPFAHLMRRLGNFSRHSKLPTMVRSKKSLDNIKFMESISLSATAESSTKSDDQNTHISDLAAISKQMESLKNTMDKLIEGNKNSSYRIESLEKQFQKGFGFLPSRIEIESHEGNTYNILKSIKDNNDEYEFFIQNTDPGTFNIILNNENELIATPDEIRRNLVNILKAFRNDIIQNGLQVGKGKDVEICFSWNDRRVTIISSTKNVECSVQIIVHKLIKKFKHEFDVSTDNQSEIQCKIM